MPCEIAPEINAYHLLVFKLKHIEDKVYKAVLHKAFPLTFLTKPGENFPDLDTYAPHIAATIDKKGNIWMLTSCYRQKIELTSSGPKYRSKYLLNYIVKINNASTLDELKIDRYDISEYSDDLRIKGDLKEKLLDFYKGSTNGTFLKARWGILNVTGDTLAFLVNKGYMYQDGPPENYIKKAVFFGGVVVIKGDGQIEVKQFEDLIAKEMEYEEYLNFREVLNFFYYNPPERIAWYTNPSPMENTLFFGYLSPQGIFYHKEFKVAE